MARTSKRQHPQGSRRRTNTGTNRVANHRQTPTAAPGPRLSESHGCDRGDVQAAMMAAVHARVLAVLRRARRLSQEELAEQVRSRGCRVAASTVSRVECGGTASLHRLAAVCDSLSCRPSRFIAAVEDIVRKSDAAAPGTEIDHLCHGIGAIVAADPSTEGPSGVAPWLGMADHVGPAIRIARVQANLTQAQLAAALARPGRAPAVTYLSALEAGRKRVSWQRLLEVCRALRRRPSELLAIAEERACVASAPVPPDLRDLLTQVRARLDDEPTGPQRTFLQSVEVDILRRLG